MNLTPFFPLAKPWLSTYRRFARCPSGESVFRILTFHDVPERSYAAFERIIRYVQQEHRILSPLDAIAILEGQQVETGAHRIGCLFTFDDGYASNAKIARALLDLAGIKAVFFVCASLLDIAPVKQPEAASRYMFEGKKVPGDTRFMTWEDVAWLDRAGHTIGSHTLSHRRLTALSSEERKDEIIRSADLMKDRLNKPCSWFAYPFGTIGSIDPASLGIIAQHYRYCCSGIRGLNSSATSPFALRRDSVELEAPFEYQLLSLCGGLDFIYTGAAKRLAKYTSALQGR